jgi:hypothetical protein
MTVLVSAPDFDYMTRYLHAWSKKLASELRGKSHDVLLLEGKNATHKRVVGMLRKQPIDVVVLNGHGNANEIAGHDNETLIDTETADLLSGKDVHALSCQTAAELGKAAMRAGAKSYIGYADKFVLVFDRSKTSRPLDDDTAALFLEPAFSAPRALCNGKSADEAVKTAKAAYRASISRALNSDVQSDYDKYVQFLWRDMNAIVSC